MILKCDGIIQQYTDELKEQVQSIKDSMNIVPTIAIIRVLGDDASGVYVRLKEKKCKEIGVNSIVIELDESSSQEDVINAIEKMNMDSNVNGILVQLPLPKHLNEEIVTNSISPLKDADCLTAYNVGKAVTGSNMAIASCTPKGIMRILKSYCSLEGLTAVIINRSNIVGKPLQNLLLNENVTTIVAHSRTPQKSLKNLVSQADILITAVGKPDFITSDYNPHRKQIIIDVSMNRDKQGKLCGDVNKSLYEHSNLFVTPVPGSIGPMTILSLISNTINLAIEQNNSINSK